MLGKPREESSIKRLLGNKLGKMCPQSRVKTEEKKGPPSLVGGCPLTGRWTMVLPPVLCPSRDKVYGPDLLKDTRIM